MNLTPGPEAAEMTGRESLVAALERTVGHRLPDDYRRFLTSGPVPRWETEAAPENPYTEILHSFYDVEAAEAERDLSAAWEGRAAELPGWFFPIGEAFGLTLGLGLAGSQRGRVYQWSSDHEEATELAPSFEAFLAWARGQGARWDNPRE